MFWIALSVFRAHVFRRADHRARLGHAGLAGGHAGEAEVRDLGCADGLRRLLVDLAEEDVGGLHVAVDEVGLVGDREAGEDLPGRSTAWSARGRAPRRRDQVGERRSGDVLHRQVAYAVYGAQRVDGDDVGGAAGLRPPSPLVRSAGARGVSCARSGRRILRATIRSSATSPRLEHEAHAAASEQFQHFVGAEACRARRRWCPVRGFPRRRGCDRDAPWSG